MKEGAKPRHGPGDRNNIRQEEDSKKNRQKQWNEGTESIGNRDTGKSAHIVKPIVSMVWKEDTEADQRSEAAEDARTAGKPTASV